LAPPISPTSLIALDRQLFPNNLISHVTAAHNVGQVQRRQTVRSTSRFLHKVISVRHYLAAIIAAAISRHALLDFLITRWTEGNMCSHYNPLHQSPAYCSLPGAHPKWMFTPKE